MNDELEEVHFLRRSHVNQVFNRSTSVDSGGGTVLVVDNRINSRSTRSYLHDYHGRRLQTLTDFDGTDLHKRFFLLPTENSSSHLFLITLIEQLCSYLETDSDKKKVLFTILCRHLSQLKIISPSYCLDEFIPLRKKYGRHFSNLVEVIKNSLSNTDKMLIPFQRLDSGILNRLRLSSFSNTSEWESHYSEGFEEIEKIGKGGFGVVYKVRNKLDNCYYAVKIIHVKNTTPEAYFKILKEVQVFASLKHSHVVGYNSAWLENHFIRENSDSTCSSADASSDNIDNLQESESSGNIIFESVPAVEHDSAVKSSNIKEDNVRNSANNQETVGYLKPSRKQSFSKSESYLPKIGMESSKQSVSEIIKSTNFHYENNQHAEYKDCNPLHSPFHLRSETYLYIQMQLCSETLRIWINRQNQKVQMTPDVFSLVSRYENLRIFKQVLEGVEYIHSKNIIHRDLTPTNIFFDFDDKRVLIGDFGLAREDLFVGSVADASKSSHCSLSDEYTCGIGTVTYASPEQKTGCTYDTKSDIYSLGLILFEMYHPYFTEMEKAENFKNVRLKKIPPAFQKRWPKEANLIQTLTSDVVADRPTASDILQNDLFHSKDQKIRYLEELLNEKDLEIERLKSQLKLNK